MMDPNSTLSELLSAIETRDWDQVEELADALLRWMENSGFPPQTLGDARIGRTWHRSVATFICMAALAKVRAARKRQSRRGA